MKAFFLSGVVLACLGTSVFAGEGTVIIPKDNTPFGINESDCVRIKVHGIAGTSITAVVTGDGKLESSNSVTQLPAGNGKPPIGTIDMEFNVKATKAGAYTVDVTVSPPAGGKATTTTYKVTVK